MREDRFVQLVGHQGDTGSRWRHIGLESCDDVFGRPVEQMRRKSTRLVEIRRLGPVFANWVRTVADLQFSIAQDDGGQVTGRVVGGRVTPGFGALRSLLVLVRQRTLLIIRTPYSCHLRNLMWSDKVNCFNIGTFARINLWRTRGIES